jgi:hypothetical protein
VGPKYLMAESSRSGADRSGPGRAYGPGSCSAPQPHGTPALFNAIY